MNREKIILLFFMSILLIGIFTEVVLGVGVNTPLQYQTLWAWFPQSGQNWTGSINLSAVLSPQFVPDVGPPSAANWSVGNITFMFQLVSNHSIWNVTLHNITANQSMWGNQTPYNFNTTNGSCSTYGCSSAPFGRLIDGTYNLSVMMINVTDSDGTKHYEALINYSVGVSIIIDNTLPAVSTIALDYTGTYNFTSYNITFNVSLKDLTIQSAALTPAPGLVIFEFSNASGNDFNVTPENKSGHWSSFYNVSSLHAGSHTVTIHANDSTAGASGEFHWNRTQTITFDLNDPHNVTWHTADGDGWGYSTGNINFNITIGNRVSNKTNAPITNVIYMFDNASRSGVMNVSNTTGPEQGYYWNITYNVSTLPVGTHTVKIFANDSLGHNNITESITFVINNTPHNVTWFATSTVNLSGQRYNISSNVVVFNVSIKNGTHAPIGDIIFMFNNASKSNQMNITNSSNTLLGQYWNASFNVSTLPVGTHIVTVFANDTLGHLNKTETLTFIVDSTPHNVTLYTLRGGSVNGQNFSVRNTTSVFNFSVINSTYLSPIHTVILMFDNASGTDFNVSASIQGGTFGRLWNTSYNVSALEEGSNTVTVFANDTLGHFNKTETFTFNVDKTDPVITVTCTDSPTVGDTVTCTCAATDSLSGVSVGPFIGSTSSTSETTTASGTVPVTSSTCTATDRAGNVGTGTGSWTPVAASTGGSGASGGGGGQSSGVTGTFAKEVWTSINAGETAKVEVTNGAIGVTEVSFSVADTTYGAWLKVEKKESLPSDVASFSGKTYKTVEITESNIKKALTGTAKIEFKVTKVWLSENGLGKTDVAMHRYAEGKWNELKTTVGEDDGTSVYYTAETSGFSYFIIGQKSGAVAGPAKEAAAEKVAGEKAAAGEEAAGEEAAAGEEVVAGEGKGIWTWVIVVLVIIALIAIAFWLKKR